MGTSLRRTYGARGCPSEGPKGREPGGGGGQTCGHQGDLSPQVDRGDISERDRDIPQEYLWDTGTSLREN